MNVFEELNINRIRTSSGLILTFLVLSVTVLLYSFTNRLEVSVVFFLGYCLAALDTSIGMGYGTIGTPILLIIGIVPIVAVPLILLSQFVETTLGSIAHRKFKNGDVFNFKQGDGKVSLVLITTGITGAALGVITGITIPKIYVSIYISFLVTAIGFLVSYPPSIDFSWRKIIPVGFVSGFNKAISGGGYGPLIMSGLMVSGKPVRNSVAVSIFSVSVITLFSAFIYFLSDSFDSYFMMAAIIMGAVVGSQVGPKVTKNLASRKSGKLIGLAVVVMGLLTLINTFIKP